MKDGYWINYETGKNFEIDEHERWIRRGGNATKLGIPSFIQDDFEKYVQVDQRNEFLMYLMQNAPIMRMRGHGTYLTFEFSSDSIRKPLEAVYEFCSNRAGPYTQLIINNFAKKDSVQLNWKEFKQRYSDDETILRESLESFTGKMKMLTKFDTFISNLNESIG